MTETALKNKMYILYLTYIVGVYQT